jgi:type IV pilus assembly protein PilW
MKGARGFTLVELMVAMTLALIVTLAVISVFAGSSAAYKATSGTAASTDGGRFALDFIEAAVRNAGFMACSRASSQTSILNPAASPLFYTFTEPLGGFEATGTAPGGAYTILEGTPASPLSTDSNAGDWKPGQDPADWQSGLDPALISAAPPVGVIKGNDVLVVRSTVANTQPVYVTGGSTADGTNPIPVTGTTTALAGLTSGQIGVISDCAVSLVMQMSNIAKSGTSGTITLSGGGGAGNNSTTSFLPLSFQPGAEITAVDTVVYYIGTGADGDGALFSYDIGHSNTTPATTFPNGMPYSVNELVPDVEAMQVLYGLDTSGTQVPSEYVTADNVPDFNHVMSVKVAVLAASPPGAVSPPAVAPTFNLLGTTVTAPIDTRTRKVFEITVAVRNALP